MAGLATMPNEWASRNIQRRTGNMRGAPRATLARPQQRVYSQMLGGLRTNRCAPRGGRVRYAPMGEDGIVSGASIPSELAEMFSAMRLVRGTDYETTTKGGEAAIGFTASGKAKIVAKFRELSALRLAYSKAHTTATAIAQSGAIQPLVDAMDNVQAALNADIAKLDEEVGSALDAFQGLLTKDETRLGELVTLAVIIDIAIYSLVAIWLKNQIFAEKATKTLEENLNDLKDKLEVNGRFRELRAAAKDPADRAAIDAAQRALLMEIDGVGAKNKTASDIPWGAIGWFAAIFGGAYFWNKLGLSPITKAVGRDIGGFLDVGGRAGRLTSAKQQRRQAAEVRRQARFAAGYAARSEPADVFD